MAEVRVSVELLDGMAFTGQDQRGRVLTMDAALASGEHSRGPTPVTVLAMALGGCTGMDVISILRKMRQKVPAYTVQVSGPRAETQPQVFTALTVIHEVRGDHVDPAEVRRAVELSATRYCSVGAMLGRALPLTHGYRVLSADGTEQASGMLDLPAMT